MKQDGGQLNVLLSDCVTQGQGIGQAASRANGDGGCGSNSAISTTTAIDTVTNETQRLGSPWSGETLSPWSYFWGRKHDEESEPDTQQQTHMH